MHKHHLHVKSGSHLNGSFELSLINKKTARGFFVWVTGAAGIRIEKEA